MRRIYTICLVAVVAASLTGCTSLRHINGSAFVEMAKDEPISSFHGCTYIGVSHNRAYLQYNRMPFIGRTQRTIVYWTALSDLPVELVKQLRTGNPPWDKDALSKRFKSDVEHFLETMKDGEPTKPSTTTK